jgi:hypothetical protein
MDDESTRILTFLFIPPETIPFTDNFFVRGTKNTAQTAHIAQLESGDWHGTALSVFA